MADYLVITAVGEGRYGEFIDFIDKEFWPRETLAKSTGLDNTPDLKFHQQVETYLREGSSFVAIDSRTDQIIGICLNYIMDKSNPHATIASETEMLGTVLSFVDQIEGSYNVYQELGVERGMELFLLGVKEEYGGRGIGRKLMEKTIELAHSMKLDFIVGTATAKITGHLFPALGFKPINMMKPIDFFIDGKLVFPCASDQDICTFHVKKF